MASSDRSTLRPANPDWKLNTISDGTKLWANSKFNSGGRLWYPPGVESQGYRLKPGAVTPGVEVVEICLGVGVVLPPAAG
jgi:hypothetical protein